LNPYLTKRKPEKENTKIMATTTTTSMFSHPPPHVSDNSSLSSLSSSGSITGSTPKGRSALSPRHPLLVMKKDKNWYTRTRMDLDLTTFTDDDNDNERLAMMRRMEEPEGSRHNNHVVVSVLSGNAFDFNDSAFHGCPTNDPFGATRKEKSSRPRSTVRESALEEGLGEDDPTSLSTRSMFLVSNVLKRWMHSVK
jgi:hypothetical protein